MIQEANFTIRDGEEVNLRSGIYGVHPRFTFGGGGLGTAKLLISVAGSAFKDIANASWADTDPEVGGVLEVPDCKVRADTTGSGEITIGKINNRS